MARPPQAPQTYGAQISHLQWLVRLAAVDSRVDTATLARINRLSTEIMRILLDVQETVLDKKAQ